MVREKMQMNTSLKKKNSLVDDNGRISFKKRNMEKFGWIVEVFENDVKKWHKSIATLKTKKKNMKNFARKIHYYNFKLWHHEDDARMTGVSDSVIAHAKRNIDKLNQLRNNAIENFDEWVLQEIKFDELNKQGKYRHAKKNSETPGSMVDRLSILSLKIYHMSIEARRQSAGKAHMLNCREKCSVLKEQRRDLVRCLEDFMNDFKNGEKYFKIYRQFKMYNDPLLNPKLYGKSV